MWRRGEGLDGRPGLAEGGFDGSGGEAQVGEELAVRTVLAVVGLAGGHGEDFLDEADVEVQKEGAVK